MEFLTIVGTGLVFLAFIAQRPHKPQVYAPSSKGYPSPEEIEEGKARIAQKEQNRVNDLRDKARPILQSRLRAGHTSSSFTQLFGGCEVKFTAAAVRLREELKEQGIEGVEIYDDWWPDLG